MIPVVEANVTSTVYYFFSEDAHVDIKQNLSCNCNANLSLLCASRVSNFSNTTERAAALVRIRFIPIQPINIFIICSDTNYYSMYEKKRCSLGSV